MKDVSNKRAPKKAGGKTESEQVSREYESIRFKDAIGKTISSIEQVIMDEEDGWNLELTFTDGTLLLFDMSAKLQVRAQYMRNDNGVLTPMRHYNNTVH